MASSPEILPPIGLVAELDEAVRYKLSVAGHFHQRPIGYSIATQGQPHQTLSVLLSGKATVSCTSRGTVIQLAVLEAGDTVGEMNIMDPYKASADVIMTTPGKVWSIAEQEFQQVVSTDPYAAYCVLRWLGRQLCRRIRRNTDRMMLKATEERMHFRDMDY